MTAEATAATGTADTEAQAATTDEAATGSTAATGQADEPQTEATTTTEEQSPAEVPEAYEFTMPEGMELDQALLDKATPTFKELGLSNDQAAKLVAIYAEHLGGMGEGAQAAFDQAYQERQAAETAQRADEWLTAAKADTEIGGAKFDGVKQRVIDAVGAVGTPEMKQAFNDMGWGNHPELIRFAHRLIDYIPPDKGERPASGGGADTPIEARVYPNMK